MAWTIKITDKAQKQYAKLDHTTQQRIADSLKVISLLDDPRQRGKALTANRKGFWRYRVGDYRLIRDIKDHDIVIVVVHMAHRSVVYK